MTPSSFDDELAAAAALVASQREAARARAEEAQHAAEEEARAEAARAEAWDDLQVFARSCAARLSTAEVPPTRMFGQTKGLFGIRSKGYPIWSIPAGTPFGKPDGVLTDNLTLHHGGLFWLATSSFAETGRSGEVPPLYDEDRGVTGLFMKDATVVLVYVEGNATGVVSEHTIDVRGALAVEVVKLLGAA